MLYLEMYIIISFLQGHVTFIYTYNKGNTWLFLRIRGGYQSCPHVRTKGSSATQSLKVEASVKIDQGYSASSQWGPGRSM